MRTEGKSLLVPIDTHTCYVSDGHLSNWILITCQCKSCKGEGSDVHKHLLSFETSHPRIFASTFSNKTQSVSRASNSWSVNSCFNGRRLLSWKHSLSESTMSIFFSFVFALTNLILSDTCYVLTEFWPVGFSLVVCFTVRTDRQIAWVKKIDHEEKNHQR